MIMVIMLDRLSMKANQLSMFIMDILRTLTTQSNVKLSSLRYLGNFKPFSREIIILVIFWLIFANIITKSFNSLLLNSYFKQKSVPLVNNLQEIFDQDHFQIAAKKNSFKFMFRYGMFSEKQVDILWERREKYQDKVKLDFNVPLVILDKTIFNDLINGLTVILINGFERELFESQYARERDRYKVLDKKYVSNFAAHLIPKNNTYLDVLVIA